MAMKPPSRRSRSSPKRNWPAPRFSPSTDPRRRQTRATGPIQSVEPDLILKAGPGPIASKPTLDAILDDFTRSWERGERPRAEGYLDLLSFEDSADLIYHEFCLAESAGLDPDPAEYLSRFPEQAASLSRLFALPRGLLIRESSRMGRASGTTGQR